MARYLALLVMIVSLTVIGLVLFVVPGLFVVHRFFLAPYYLFDKNTSAIEAMRMSAQNAKRYSRSIWEMLAVYVVLAILSIIIIGYILFYLYICAPAIRYIQIQKLLKSRSK